MVEQKLQNEFRVFYWQTQLQAISVTRCIVVDLHKITAERYNFKSGILEVAVNIRIVPNPNFT